MTSITFGEKVTSIEDGVFAKITSLSKIYSLNPVPPTTSSTFSETTYQSATLYVPEESIASYQAADGWKNFYDNIVSELEDVTAKADALLKVSGNTLTIADGCHYEVVSISGTVMHRGSNGGELSLAPGIYIATVNGSAQKIAIR